MGTFTFYLQWSLAAYTYTTSFVFDYGTPLSGRRVSRFPDIDDVALLHHDFPSSHATSVGRWGKQGRRRLLFTYEY